MSQDNKAVVQRIVDGIWNDKDASLIDELYASDCIIHTPDGELHGPDGYLQLYDTYASAFPDAELMIDGEMIAEGDLVATPYTFCGTQDGPLQEIAPTGRQVSVRGVAISRIIGGKVHEERTVWDSAALLQQLGVLLA